MRIISSIPLLISFHLLVNAQKIQPKIPDSLKGKDYEYLDNKIYELRKDSLKASIYLNVYLQKAKREHNYKEQVNGYQNLLHQSPVELKLIYADSMILSAKKSSENSLIGSAYLSKGIVYYSQKKLNTALDHYLIANSHISKTNDKYLTNKVKYHIALIKYYLGFYNEALSLFKDCISFFKEENPRPYLNSLHCLGLCYNKLGNYGLCSQTNSLGLSESKRLSIHETEAFFIHSEGINNYFQHNYGASIKNISSTLEQLKDNDDFANVSIGNFYIGKSYWALGKKEDALPYFHKVDSIFKIENYIRPDLREVYEILISYYKKKNDLNKQLYYIDQLLKADKELHETYSYLISKVHKEYDTLALISEKEKIQLELAKEKKYDIYFVGIICFLFILIVFFTYRHYKIKTLYKKRFDELMSKKEQNKNNVKNKQEDIHILDINSETLNSILKQIEKFENTNKFLEEDLTLEKMAVNFNFNSKYLSKIIYQYRNKGFVEYINDLRIDYIINLLNTDRKYRNYTNSALAQEAGFSSTQRFANAFKNKTGITAVFYIQELRKS